MRVLPPGEGRRSLPWIERRAWCNCGGGCGWGGTLPHRRPASTPFDRRRVRHWIAVLVWLWAHGRRS